jgi:ABC-type sugar transport system permease subunit
MTGLSKTPGASPAQQTELILRLLSIWRVVFSLLAVVGALAPWVGILPGLRLWQGILFSAILGPAAVLSFIASRDIRLLRHRGRTISLFVDYLSLVACLVVILQVGGVFIGIDALGDVFGRSVLFLLVAGGGYLISAAGDYFQHNPKIEKILRQVGKWIMILGGLTFLFMANLPQGLLALAQNLANPAGIGAVVGLVVFGIALWAMWREPSATALKSKTSHEQMLSGWLFLSPNLLGFMIFFAGPLLLSFYFSFTDSDAFNPPNWVGLQNYAKILNVTIKPLAAPDQLARDVLDIKIYDEVGRLKLGNGGILFGAEDKLFWLALRNTLTYTLFAVPLSVIPALVLANILNSKLPGMKFFRAVYFIPSIAAIVGIALVWQWLYNATVGYINYFITLGVELWNNLFNAGIVDPKIRWVSDERTALLAIIIIAAWQTMGFNTVLFLAGLQNIPGELYEAATVDGAGAWDKFWRITLPMLAPSTFYVISTTTIQAMQVFEQVFILMNPPEGPNNSTITLVLYLYRSGFQNFKQGYASALAWVLFIVIFGLTLIQFRQQRRSSIYEN